MTIKPRRPWIAAILSLVTIGLGHMYAGRAKKGLLLFGIHLVLFTLSLILMLWSSHMLGLVSIVVVGVGYLLYVIIDAIKTAKSCGKEYSLKNYNKWYFYFATIVAANLLITPSFEVIVEKYVLKTYTIPTRAMMPTIKPGDNIVVNKACYHFDEFKRGDLIVFESPRDPSQDFIKRLIGIGGDKIQLKNKKLYLNGEVQDEHYAVYNEANISDSEQVNFGPITVPEGALFVMGDNRDNSFDSRYFGSVASDKVKGKAVSIFWSWDKESKTVRWNRIGISFNELVN